MLVYIGLVPGPSHRPVFGHLQYVKMIKNWMMRRPGNKAKLIFHPFPSYPLTSSSPFPLLSYPHIFSLHLFFRLSSCFCPLFLPSLLPPAISYLLCSSPKGPTVIRPGPLVSLHLLMRVVGNNIGSNQIDFLVTLRPSGEGQPLVARALYDFHTDRTDELSFSAGDELVSEWGQQQVYIYDYEKRKPFFKKADIPLGHECQHFACY